MRYQFKDDDLVGYQDTRFGMAELRWYALALVSGFTFKEAKHFKSAKMYWKTKIFNTKLIGELWSI